MGNSFSRCLEEKEQIIIKPSKPSRSIGPDSHYQNRADNLQLSGTHQGNTFSATNPILLDKETHEEGDVRRSTNEDASGHTPGFKNMPANSLNKSSELRVSTDNKSDNQDSFHLDGESSAAELESQKEGDQSPQLEEEQKEPPQQKSQLSAELNTQKTDESPSKSLDELPTKSLDELPAKSLDESPTKSLDESPTKSLDEPPNKSLNEFPTKSLHELPTKSLNEFPTKSLNESPTKSLNESLTSDSNTLIIESVDQSDQLHYPLILLGKETLETAMEINRSDIPSDFEKIYEEKKEDHKLKIYLSTYVTPEKNRANKVRAEWYVPVTPEQFISYMSDVKEQWKVDDGSMEKFYPITVMNKTNEECYTIFYLSYKKQMIASARDMIYLKYSKKIDEDTYADCTTSVVHPDYPAKQNYVRCEFKTGGYLVKLVSGNEDGKPVSYVKMCSESDFKTNVPVFMTKSFTQTSLKGFIERCIKNLKLLYPHKA